MDMMVGLFVEWKKLIINEVIGLSNAYLIEEAWDKNQFSVE